MILYKLTEDDPNTGHASKLASEARKRWVYVDNKNVHTHDVRALTVVVPIIQEGLYSCLTSFL